jgi:hypothetical protein
VRNEDDNNFYVVWYLFYRNLWGTSRRRANLYKLVDKNLIQYLARHQCGEKVPCGSYKSCISEESTHSNLFSTCSVGFYTTTCFGFSNHLKTFKPTAITALPSVTSRKYLHFGQAHSYVLFTLLTINTVCLGINYFQIGLDIRHGLYCCLWSLKNILCRYII